MTAAYVTQPRSEGGNIFLDLGFLPEEAERLALRAELGVALMRLLRRRRWEAEVDAM